MVRIKKSNSACEKLCVKFAGCFFFKPIFNLCFKPCSYYTFIFVSFINFVIKVLMTHSYSFEKVKVNSTFIKFADTISLPINCNGYENIIVSTNLYYNPQTII